MTSRRKLTRVDSKAASTNPERPAQQASYRLRLESITYLGDDSAAARGIEKFLRLSRLREQQPRQLESDIAESNQE
jgi:hypothetical protein